MAIKDVNDTDDLMIINKSGIMIRLRMSDLRTIGRATQGVRLIKVGGNDEISSVAKVAADEKEEVLEGEALLVDGQAAGVAGEAGAALAFGVLVGANDDDEDPDGAEDDDDAEDDAEDDTEDDLDEDDAEDDDADVA